MSENYVAICHACLEWQNIQIVPLGLTFMPQIRKPKYRSNHVVHHKVQPSIFRRQTQTNNMSTICRDVIYRQPPPLPWRQFNQHYNFGRQNYGQQSYSMTPRFAMGYTTPPKSKSYSTNVTLSTNSIITFSTETLTKTRTYGHR